MLHIFTFGAKLRRPEGSSCPDQVVSNHVAITPTSPEAMAMKRHGKSVAVAVLPALLVVVSSLGTSRHVGEQVGCDMVGQRTSEGVCMHVSVSQSLKSGLEVMRLGTWLAQLHHGLHPFHTIFIHIIH